MAGTIGEILREQARARPDAVAIVDTHANRERRFTFAELEKETAAAADWLHARGLGKGKAVLVFVPMSAELYVSLLAMLRLGVVALFLDPSAGRLHIEQCCARWAPDALLAIPRAHLLRVRSAALRKIPLKIVTSGWLPGTTRWLAGRRAAGEAQIASNSGGEPLIEPGDPALVTFTSGSTGVPKAAVRTHGFLVAQHRVLEPAIALEAGDVDLATLPIFTLANLASGIATVIPNVDLKRPGNVDAASLFRQISRFGVTRMTASPAFFERLIEYGQATGQTLPTLRKLHTGGAPVFPRLLDGLRALAPNAGVVAVYGSTEAEPIAHLEAREISAEDLAAMQSGRGLLAGAPVAEITLRILHDRWGTPRGKITNQELDEETRPPGEAGEIVVTGEHVLRGYLGGVGDEETKFSVDGKVWHRSGDAGLLDASGRLWLLGRCAARIDDEHGRFYPFAVETVAMNFPEVRRAAVIAHHGERWLVIETAGEPRLIESRLLSVTSWAHIRQVKFLPKMPVDRRHNAKIDYPALRRALGME